MEESDLLYKFKTLRDIQNYNSNLNLGRISGEIFTLKGRISIRNRNIILKDTMMAGLPYYLSYGVHKMSRNVQDVVLISDLGWVGHYDLPEGHYLTDPLMGWQGVIRANHLVRDIEQNELGDLVEICLKFGKTDINSQKPINMLSRKDYCIFM